MTKCHAFKCHNFSPVRNALLMLVALQATLVAGAARGEGWLVTPALTLGQQYDDNFRLVPEPKDSVWTTTISGGVELVRQTDLVDLRAFGRVDGLFYSGETRGLPNQSNQVAGVSGFNRTELGDWELNTTYTRDSVIRTIDEIVEPSGVESDVAQDIDVDLTFSPVRRTRYLVNPGWTQRLTERSELDFGYRFNDVSYEEVEGQTLTNFRNHGLSGVFSYDLTEIDTLQTFANVDLFRPDNITEWNTFSLLLGGERNFSQRTSGGFAAGGRYTKIKASFGDVVAETDDTGFVGRVYGTTRTETTRFRAMLERRLLPSGSGDMLQTDQLMFNLTQRVSPRLLFLMQFRAFQTESILLNNSLSDRKFLDVTPSLQWNLGEDWMVEASYRYARDDRDVSSEDAIGNSVEISLKYEQARILQF